ncbi:hypothetical protein STEG23_037634, partial [Scotinomys teguina]
KNYMPDSINLIKSHGSGPHWVQLQINYYSYFGTCQTPLVLTRSTGSTGTTLSNGVVSINVVIYSISFACDELHRVEELR